MKISSMSPSRGGTELREIRVEADSLRREIASVQVDQQPGTTAILGEISGTPGTTVPGFFLVQPLRIVGTPAEGASATLANVGGTFLAWLAAGPAPSTGTKVMCRLNRGNWVAEQCSCGVSVLPCCPVSIPLGDITLTYASTGFAGNGSMVLRYAPAVGFTPPTWTTDCLDVGTYDIIGGTSPTHNYLKFQLSCSTPGQTQIHFDLYGNAACTGELVLGGFMTIDSFSGTPFHLHHVVTSGEFTLFYGGFTTLDYDSSVNAPGACKYKFNVSGCNFIAAQGVSVSAWTSAAKTTLLGTGTTDSNGDLLIVSTERTSNGHYEITGSRFTSQSGNGLTSSATNTNSFNLSAASGYHCDTGTCGWPIAGTLHMTHPVFGAVTLTYSGGHWTGTKAFSYLGNIAGGGSCAGATVTVNFDMGEDYSYTESWLYDGTDCPTDSGGNTATVFWTFEGVNCYVPSHSAFSANFSKTPNTGPQQALYGTSPLALAVTE